MFKFQTIMAFPTDVNYFYSINMVLDSSTSPSGQDFHIFISAQGRNSIFYRGTSELIISLENMFSLFSNNLLF